MTLICDFVIKLRKIRAFWLIVEPFRNNTVVVLEAHENFMHIALVVVLAHIYEFSEEVQSLMTQLQKSVKLILLCLFVSTVSTLSSLGLFTSPFVTFHCFKLLAWRNI